VRPEETVDNDSQSRHEEHPETLAVHAGGVLKVPENHASSPPLFAASSYRFDDLADVDAVYGGTRAGAIYGRYGGPNGAHFEAAMVDLEGAEAACAAASGMAAIDASVMACVAAGDAILTSADLYGGTRDLFENDLQQRGVRVRYVDQEDLAAVERALHEEHPRLLYVEALTNPLMRVADLPALAELASRAGAVSIVDATFASPVLVRPVDHGFDLVLHSVGKYIGGHADVGAGVLAGRRHLVDRAKAVLVRTGATVSHFDAWLALRGLRTLALRMGQHSANARIVAEFLETVPAVAAVYSPALPSHPEHALAARLYPRGTGGIVAFDLRGGRDAVAHFLRALRRIAIVHSLGEVATTISYSVESSHRSLAEETRTALGVTDGTLRLSVGIEHPADIVDDLAAAFAALDAAPNPPQTSRQQGFSRAFADERA
jgi:cystathionine beta-lyase/cystathionine gamma-synthase